CKDKDMKINRVRCYLCIDNKTYYNFQVDSKRHIHANMQEIKIALNNNRIVPPTKNKSPITPNSTLSHPLTAFNNPPILLYEQLKRQNYNKRTINIQITTSKMDITNLDKRIIAIEQINNNQPIASYNNNWPSKMNAANSKGGCLVYGVHQVGGGVIVGLFGEG
ncbi:16420_t:CDS:2, partial [Gigaspora rosea]